MASDNEYYLGKVTAEVSIDTTKLDKGIEDANKSLNQLSKAFQQTDKTISKHLVAINKTMTANTGAVVAQTKRMQASFKNLNANINTNTLSTIKAINKMKDEVVKEMQNMSKSFEQLQKASSRDFTTGFRKLVAASKKDTKTVVSNLQAIQKQAEATNKALSSSATVKGTSNVPRAPTTTVVSSTPKTVDLSGATNSANSFFGSLSKSWQMISQISFQAFILEQSFSMLAGTVESLVAPGFQFASSMETMRIGMAGILASTTKIGEAQTTYAQGLEISDKILKRMQIEALRTTLTVSELSEAYQSALAGGLNAGMDLNQIMDLVVASANAVKSFGLPKQQVIQEIRGLISGEAIRPGVDMMATVLGYTTATVNKLREEGTLYEDIRKRMVGFEMASYDLSTTWEGMLNNFADGINKIASVAVDKLYKNVKGRVKEMSEMLFTLTQEDFTYTDAQTGEQKTRKVVTDINLNPETLKTLTNLYNTLSSIVDVAYQLGSMVLPPLVVVFNAVASSVQVLLGFINQALVMLEPVLNALGQALTYLSELASALSDTPIGKFVSEYGAMLGVLATTGAIVLGAKVALSGLVGEIIRLVTTFSGIKGLASISTSLANTINVWNHLGTAISTTTTFTGALSAMVNVVKQATSATLLSEIAIKAWAAAKVMATGVMTAFSTLLGVLTGKIKLTTAAQVLATGATTLWATVTTALTGGIAGLAKQLALLVARIVAFLAASAATVASIVGITAAIGAVVYAVYKVSDASSALGQKWNDLWTAIGAEVDLAKAKIKQFWLEVTAHDDEAKAMQGEIDTLTSKAASAWAGYDYTTAGDIWDEFVRDAKNAANNVKEAFNPTNLIPDIDNSDLPDITSIRTAKDIAGEGGGAGKGASKLAKSAYKALEAEAKLAIASLKEQQKALDASYKNDLVSTQNYVEQSMELSRQQIEAQISALEQQKKVAEGLGQTSDVERFDNNIAELRVKAANLENEATRKLVEEYKKLDDRLDDINKKYQDLVGVSEEAFNDNLVREFAGDYTRLAAEMETAQQRFNQAIAQGKQEEISAWNIRKNALEKTISNLEKIVELKHLERQAEEASARVQSINLTVEEQYLSKKNQANRLAYTEADAEGDLFDYRKEHMDEYIDAYTDMIAMYTKMAQEAEKDGSLSQANNFRQQALEAKEALLELTDAVPPFQKVIKEQVIDNLSDAFQSMLWGEKTAKEALEDFAKGVLQTWSKKIFDRMATDITDGFFNLLLPDSEKVGNREMEIDATVQSKLKVIDVDSQEFQDTMRSASLSFQEALTNTAIPAIQQFSNALYSATGTNPPTGGDLGKGTPTLGTGSMAIGSAGADSGSSIGRGNNNTGISEGGNPSLWLDSFGQSAMEASDKLYGLGSAAKTGDEAQTGYNFATERGIASTVSMAAGLIGATSESEKLSQAMMVLMAVMQIWQMWMQMQAAKSQASGIAGIFAAKGGYISGKGTSTSDSIPARLSNGEYVVRAKAVKALGVDFLDKLNSAGNGIRGKGRLPKFGYADGGYVEAESTNDPGNMRAVGGGVQPVQIVMQNNFQSLDPSSNMNLWKQQYPMIKAQIIRDMQTNTSMRSAVKGASQ